MNHNKKIEALMRRGIELLKENEVLTAGNILDKRFVTLWTSAIKSGESPLASMVLTLQSYCGDRGANNMDVAMMATSLEISYLGTRVGDLLAQDRKNFPNVSQTAKSEKDNYVDRAYEEISRK